MSDKSSCVVRCATFGISKHATHNCEYNNYNCSKIFFCLLCGVSHIKNLMRFRKSLCACKALGRTTAEYFSGILDREKEEEGVTGGSRKKKEEKEEEEERCL